MTVACLNLTYMTNHIKQNPKKNELKRWRHGHYVLLCSLLTHNYSWKLVCRSMGLEKVWSWGKDWGLQTYKPRYARPLTEMNSHSPKTRLRTRQPRFKMQWDDRWNPCGFISNRFLFHMSGAGSCVLSRQGPALLLMKESGSELSLLSNRPWRVKEKKKQRRRNGRKAEAETCFLKHHIQTEEVFGPSNDHKSVK